MANYTLGNTRTLFEELDSLIVAGNVELPSPPKSSSGISAESILQGKVSVGDVLVSIGKGENYSMKLEKYESELAEKRAAVATRLRASLREGNHVAMPRLPQGLGAPFAKEFWDGTEADKVLSSGNHKGFEIRIATPVSLNQKGDGGEKWATNWLTINLPKRTGTKRSKTNCREDAINAANMEKISLGKLAFDRAWRRVSGKHPEWKMGKAGPKAKSSQ